MNPASPWAGGHHAYLLVSVLLMGVNRTVNQSANLLFCVHDVPWLLTEAREDQPVDDNPTPLDLRTNVRKFTDSGGNESYGQESKNKKAAKVIMNCFYRNHENNRPCL